MLKNILNLKNLHLLISVVVVVPIALIYGIFPSEVLPKMFDFRVQTTDLINVFRAIMGLYLAFVLLWVLGIINIKYWNAATLSNLLFMAGLATGRIVSIIVDGLPSLIFIIGTIGELVLAFYATFNLVKYSPVKSSV